MLHTIYIQEIIKFLTQHIILAITWILLLVIIIYIFVKDWSCKFYKISQNKAILLINKKNATIIDIRNYHDYISGHIINSINVPIEKIKKNNNLKFKKFNENPLIIVNNNGILSNSVIKYFKNMGFQEIYILSEGIIGWKNNHLPLILDK